MTNDMLSNLDNAPVCIIDDDDDVRSSLANLLESCGYTVVTFEGPDQFRKSGVLPRIACLILDVRLRGSNGLDFQDELTQGKVSVPVVLMSGHGDVPMTVRGMRAGAVTFLPKPFGEEDLLAAVREATLIGLAKQQEAFEHAALTALFESLTPRERDVLGLVAAGLMNKQIAARLDISEITVKIHRGNAMKKMKADSLADLVRMAERLGARQPLTRHTRPTPSE
jgi:FixJ family two-component response regulator